VRLTCVLTALLCLPGPPAAGPIAAAAESAPAAAARRLLDAGDYAAAAAAGRDTLAGLARTGGSESTAAATCLEVTATALARLGTADGAEARDLAERALAIRTRVQGADHRDTAAAMVVLGDVLRGQRAARPARELYERALASLRRTSGEDSVDVAAALNGIAGLRYAEGDLAGALPLYTRVVAVREAALPATHPDLADALSNLGNVRRNLGELEAARELYTRAGAIFAVAFGPDHVKVANTLNSLALTTKGLGDWVGARAASERALAIYERTLGPTHPYVAGMLNNLADLAEKLGDTDQALALLRRSLAIREQALEPEHPDIAQALNNLGDLLRRRRDVAAARPLLQRSLAIREKVLAPDHPHLARTLVSLGRLDADAGDLDGAASLIGRALAIQEKTLGEANREFAASLVDLALVELGRAHPDRATALAGRAASILSGVVGDDHPDWAEAALTQARAAAAAGDRGLALDLALRAEAAARRHLQDTARLLTEHEALSYAAARTRGRDLALDLLDDPRATADERRRVWEATVAARGVVLEALVERAAALREGRDPRLGELRSELDRATEALARHLVSPPRGDDDAVRARLDETRRRRDAAERALAAASADAGERLARRNPSLAQAAAALDAAAALVTYVRYERVAHGGDAAYLAFVLRPAEPAPRVIRLGSGDAVDGAVRAWFAEAAGPQPGPGPAADALLAYRRAGRTLRQTVWDPLQPALAGAALVLVVPDGALHLVNLATLPVGRGDYLLERGPLLHRLGSERELLLLTDDARRGRGLLALGAARLEPRGTSREAAPSSPPEPPHGGGPAPLPGAAAELREIARTWARVGSGEVVLLTGVEATEGALQRLAPGRRAIHLATHGIQPETGPAVAGRRGVGGLSGPVSLSTALLLEGHSRTAALLLAPDPGGAALADDGILTVPEIGLLDLAGVEWTVLSACDTGRGEVHASEGVLGLERAFRAAGSRTVIVSLWAADDDATRELMTELYRARLSAGASTAEAMRRAALRVLERRRGSHSSHPFAWGAFVATGDWR